MFPYNQGDFYMDYEWNKNVFLEKKWLEYLLSNLKWKSRDFKKVSETIFDTSDLVYFKPDFYPEGYILAATTKAIIICDGSSVINYRDTEFKDVSQIIETFGIEAIRDYDNWNFEQEKEWLVRKLNGQWIYSFTSVIEMKSERELKC